MGRMSMSRRILVFATFAIALGASGTAGAEERTRPQARGGRVLDAETVERNVATLFKTVPFAPSLDAAKKEAAARGRLILWVHALGDLAGDT